MVANMGSLVHGQSDGVGVVREEAGLGNGGHTLQRNHTTMLLGTLYAHSMLGELGGMASRTNYSYLCPK
jgi:hypothetical protein